MARFFEVDSAAGFPRFVASSTGKALAGVVRLNLSIAGFDVTVARNGEEGWIQVQKQSFDRVVTDQQIPKLHGEQLATRIRALDHYQNVPIIMVTAKGMELDVEELKRRAGISQVLDKPFSPTVLVQTAEECLADQVA